MPTVARLAGAQLPHERRIDGRDIWPLLSTPGAPSPHEAFFFYWGGGLEAVRRGQWKLHLPHPYTAIATPRTSGGARGTLTRATLPRSLFDLDADPGWERPAGR